MKSHEVYEVYNLNDLLAFFNKAQGSIALALCHSAIPFLLNETDENLCLRNASQIGIQNDEVFSGWGAVADNEKVEEKISIQYIYSMILLTVPQNFHKNNATESSGRHIVFSLPWQIQVWTEGEGLSYHVSNVLDKTHMNVEISGSGKLWIETVPPHSDGFCVSVELTGISPADIFIGKYRESPQSTKFNLCTKDFHSAAVGKKTALIRGGCRGKISSIDPYARDHLIIDNGQEISSDYSGFYKNGCPGRQSAWIKLDEKTEPSLYVSCERGPTSEYRNKLFVFNKNNVADEAKQFGIDFKGCGTFKFIDWLGDGTPVIAHFAENKVLSLYKLGSNKFESIFSVELYDMDAGINPQIIPFQYLDLKQPSLLIVGNEIAHLLVNSEACAYLISGSTIGIGKIQAMVTLCDTDGNGFLDIVSAEGKYWKQRTDGTFTEFVWCNSLKNTKIIDSRVMVTSSATSNYLIAALKLRRGRFISKIVKISKMLHGLIPASFFIQTGFVQRPEKWALHVFKNHLFDVASKIKYIALEIRDRHGDSLSGLLWRLELNDGKIYWPESFEGSKFSQGTRFIQLALLPEQQISGVVFIGKNKICNVYFSYEKETAGVKTVAVDL